MTGKEKATAPVSSVGADGKQSLCNKSNRSIADLPQKGNLPSHRKLSDGVRKNAE